MGIVSLVGDGGLDGVVGPFLPGLPALPGGPVLGVFPLGGGHGLLLGEGRVLGDGGVHLGVEVLHRLHLGGLEALVPLGELLLVVFLALLLQGLHVLVHVGTEDPVAVHLGVVGGVPLAVHGVAGELVGRVGDVDSSIAGSLHGSEDLVAGGGVDQADVEDGLEGPPFGVGLFSHAVVFAVHSALAGVDRVHLQLLQETPGQEEAGAVGGRVVGQAGGEAELLEFQGGGGAEHLVALQGGVHHLHDHLLVGQTHHHPVLGGVVLVLVLDDHPLPGVVISLAFSSPPVLGLVPLEVRLGLLHFHESH